MTHFSSKIHTTFPLGRIIYSPISHGTAFYQVGGYGAIWKYMLLLLKPTFHDHILSCKDMHPGLKIHLQNMWAEHCLNKILCFYRIIYYSGESLIPMTTWPAVMFNIHSLLLRQKTDIRTHLIFYKRHSRFSKGKTFYKYDSKICTETVAPTQLVIVSDNVLLILAITSNEALSANILVVQQAWAGWITLLIKRTDSSGPALCPRCRSQEKWRIFLLSELTAFYLLNV